MTANEIARLAQAIIVWGWVFPFLITLTAMIATSFCVDGKWVLKYNTDEWGEIIVRAMAWPVGLYSLYVFWHLQIENWWSSRR